MKFVLEYYVFLSFKSRWKTTNGECMCWCSLLHTVSLTLLPSLSLFCVWASHDFTRRLYECNKRSELAGCALFDFYFFVVVLCCLLRGICAVFTIEMAFYAFIAKRVSCNIEMYTRTRKMPKKATRLYPHRQQIKLLSLSRSLSWYARNHMHIQWQTLFLAVTPNKKT